MEFVAHRAGNRLERIEPALAAGADLVELDVHLFRGRLEVRHAKVLWPLARLWEKGEILPADTPRPSLRTVLEGAGGHTPLWIDLKGFSGRFWRRVEAAIGDRQPLVVSSRSWWILRGARRRGGTRTFRSVGNRSQRWAVQRIRRWADTDGVVIHERLVSRESMARLIRRTPNVFVWGMVDLDRSLELAGLGVRGLIVDDLGLIERVNDRLGLG